MHELFTLDKDFNLVLTGTNKLFEDSLQKAYIYANLYFYDEIQKEMEKLRALVRKLHDDIIAELGLDPNEPEKLLLELSTRVRNALGGDDSLDAVIKEMLAERSKHMSLVPSDEERKKVITIQEAIFIELTDAFYNMTFHSARDVDGKKVFRLAQEYINLMSMRQKKLLSPTVKMVGFANQIKMNEFELTQDWSVRYIPEQITQPFSKQEDAMKAQIKEFAQKNMQ